MCCTAMYRATTPSRLRGFRFAPEIAALLAHRGAALCAQANSHRAALLVAAAGAACLHSAPALGSQPQTDPHRHFRRSLPALCPRPCPALKDRGPRPWRSTRVCSARARDSRGRGRDGGVQSTGSDAPRRWRRRRALARRSGALLQTQSLRDNLQRHPRGIRGASARRAAKITRRQIFRLASPWRNSGGAVMERERSPCKEGPGARPGRSGTATGRQPGRQPGRRGGD